MLLKSLQLFNFKNHAEILLDLCPQVNCITGLNGTGKTNILDAVYYLSNAKSFFNGIDQQIMRKGENFFSIHGWFGGENLPGYGGGVLLMEFFRVGLCNQTFCLDCCYNNDIRNRLSYTVSGDLQCWK